VSSNHGSNPKCDKAKLIHEVSVDNSVGNDMLLFSAELDCLAELATRDADRAQGKTASFRAQQMILSSGSVEPVFSLLYRDPTNAHLHPVRPSRLHRRPSAAPLVERKARDVANWIQDKTEQTGARLRAPKTQCARYDSTADCFDDRAPGANDNGSGVLLVAVRDPPEPRRLPGQRQARRVHRRGTGADRKQSLCQRAEGSRVYTGVLQRPTDAYHPRRAIPAFASRTHRSLLGYSGSISLVFLRPGTIFESVGAILGPFYHKSGNFSNFLGYGFNQVQYIAKATLLTMLEVAGFDIGVWGARNPEAVFQNRRSALSCSPVLTYSAQTAECRRGNNPRRTNIAFRNI
ncbi:hypothetical protein BOTBODRAFT_49448, partial [Botryobasidium botryosum FD-172 SS1]